MTQACFTTAHFVRLKSAVPLLLYANHVQVLWANPLLTPLPHTPLRVFCLYGAGKQTEVGYHYRYSATPNVTYEIETRYASASVGLPLHRTQHRLVGDLYFPTRQYGVCPSAVTVCN